MTTSKNEKRLAHLAEADSKRKDKLHDMYVTFGTAIPGRDVNQLCIKNGRQCDFLVHDLDGQARCAKPNTFTKPAVGLIIENNRVKRNIKEGDGDYCAGYKV